MARYIFFVKRIKGIDGDLDCGKMGHQMENDEMNFYSKRKPVNGYRYGLGFKSKTQGPLIMIWKEWWHHGEVVIASIIFQTGHI